LQLKVKGRGLGQVLSREVKGEVHHWNLPGSKSLSKDFSD
jgi:hypothetical protein